MIKLIKECAIILSIVSSCTIVALANNVTPTTEPIYTSLIENSEMSFSVEDKADEMEFLTATFSKEKKTVFLETEKRIEYIQVLNKDGQLEYQLPIESNKLHLDMQDFIPGLYNLNILLEGNEGYIQTKLQKSL